LTKNQKEAAAIFRYGVISDFVNGAIISRAGKRRLLEEKSGKKWEIPFSDKSRISKGGILRWIRLYNESGKDIASLYPKQRCDKGKSRTVDDDTFLALAKLRKEYPETTVNSLTDKMHEHNLTTPGCKLCYSTVYRFLKQNNLMDMTKKTPEDRRKFEAELPNDLWQSDVMHGPRVVFNDKNKKTCLIAIIDDHSRLIVYANFYFSENLVSYMDAFQNALLKRGLPRKLYVDNGAAFRSRRLAYTAASLNIALIHARPYKPQGKGKIERWFKTVRSSFLPDFKGGGIEYINDALGSWINDKYHEKKHSSTGQTPFERFTSNMQCLRTAPSDLKDYFRITARRKVAEDRTITLNGRLYEGPVALIGKQVELCYHADEPGRIEVKYKNESYGNAAPVNMAVNCRIKRDKNSNADMETTIGADYHGGKLL